MGPCVKKSKWHTMCIIESHVARLLLCLAYNNLYVIITSDKYNILEGIKNEQYLVWIKFCKRLIYDA